MVPSSAAGTDWGSGGVIAGSALPGEEVGACRESTGAAARLCSTLQSLQSEKGSAGVISRQLPLSSRSPSRRKLSPPRVALARCSPGGQEQAKRAQLRPASNPPKPATQVRLLWMSLSRGRRSEPGCWHSLCRATDHPARGQLLPCCRLPAKAERVPEAAHPAPRNKQCCYERQGGVCPGRHFSSSPFQAQSFVPLPAPPARIISHTSAFAQCQRCPCSCAGQTLPACCQHRDAARAGDAWPFLERVLGEICHCVDRGVGCALVRAGLDVLSRASCCHHL